jgi:hypothetical protein
MLAAEVHLGTKNYDYQMERYVFKIIFSRFIFSDLSIFIMLVFLAHVLVCLDNGYMAVDFDFGILISILVLILPANFDSSSSSIQTL